MQGEEPMGCEDKPEGSTCSITAWLEAASSGQGGQMRNILHFPEAALPLSAPLSAP